MKLLFILCLMAVGGISAAQEFKVLNRQQAEKTLASIAAVSSGINTLECDFREEKSISVLAEKVVSSGKMYYRKEDCIRWEYREPQNYLLIAAGGEIAVKYEEKIERSGPAVRAFREICNLILGSISGRQLTDETRFVISYSGNAELFRITLVPRNKRMKQFINEMHMVFSLPDHEIRSVIMKQGEDETRILFGKRNINGELEPRIFEL